MSITVRRASVGDAAAACAVLRRSITHLCVADHRNDPGLLASWLDNKTPDRVAAWFAAPESFAAVALQAEQMVGCALLQRRGEVQLCYVAPEATRCGVGRLLLQSLEARAREWGLAQAHLSSTLTAKLFYERLGYVAAGEPQNIFGLQAFPMAKLLNEATRSP
jgi:GNAT superfamily N-acetyltransferase